MDKTNSKILTVSFALTGAITAFALSLLIQAFAGIFGWVARLSGVDAFKHGVPVVAGLAIFLVLQFNPRALAWGDEVVTELRKVVWPSRKDTTAMTIVVVIMVIISSLVVSAFDMFSGYVLNFLMR